MNCERKFLIQLLAIVYITMLIWQRTGEAGQPGDVIINELMWMGDATSTSHEWIELRNTTGAAIDLTKLGVDSFRR